MQGAANQPRPIFFDRAIPTHVATEPDRTPQICHSEHAQSAGEEPAFLSPRANSRFLYCAVAFAPAPFGMTKIQCVVRRSSFVAVPTPVPTCAKHKYFVYLPHLECGYSKKAQRFLTTTDLN